MALETEDEENAHPTVQLSLSLVSLIWSGLLYLQPYWRFYTDSTQYPRPDSADKNEGQLNERRPTRTDGHQGRHVATMLAELLVESTNLAVGLSCGSSFPVFP